MRDDCLWSSYHYVCLWPYFTSSTSGCEIKPLKPFAIKFVACSFLFCLGMNFASSILFWLMNKNKKKVSGLTCHMSLFEANPFKLRSKTCINSKAITVLKQSVYFVVIHLIWWKSKPVLFKFHELQQNKPESYSDPIERNRQKEKKSTNCKRIFVIH